jgi:hypothetical protein
MTLVLISLKQLAGLTCDRNIRIGTAFALDIPGRRSKDPRGVAETGNVRWTGLPTREYSAQVRL